MGGLGHYLEQEGIPTTQISLVREHTEMINPPRALWVPFELGRPFGAPDAPAFQRRVLKAALDLLLAPKGPVLVDFPESAPEAEITEGWACALNLPPPPGDDSALAVALAQEVEATRLWHDLWRERRGRSTVGAAGLDIEQSAAFMAAFLESGEPAMPDTTRKGIAPAALLKLVVEDVKAFYMEAAMAKPGSPTSQALADWFWGETIAGRIMLALRPLLMDHADESLRHFARGVLVPKTQLYRLD